MEDDDDWLRNLNRRVARSTPAPLARNGQDDWADGWLVPFHVTHQSHLERRERELAGNRVLTPGDRSAQVTASTSAQAARRGITTEEQDSDEVEHVPNDPETSIQVRRTQRGRGGSLSQKLAIEKPTRKSRLSGRAEETRAVQKQSERRRTDLVTERKGSNSKEERNDEQDAVEFPEEATTRQSRSAVRRGQNPGVVKPKPTMNRPEASDKDDDGSVIVDEPKSNDEDVVEIPKESTTRKKISQTSTKSKPEDKQKVTRQSRPSTSSIRGSKKIDPAEEVCGRRSRHRSTPSRTSDDGMASTNSTIQSATSSRANAKKGEQLEADQRKPTSKRTKDAEKEEDNANQTPRQRDIRTLSSTPESEMMALIETVSSGRYRLRSTPSREADGKAETSNRWNAKKGQNTEASKPNPTPRRKTNEGKSDSADEYATIADDDSDIIEIPPTSSTTPLRSTLRKDNDNAKKSIRERMEEEQKKRKTVVFIDDDEDDDDEDNDDVDDVTDAPNTTRDPESLTPTRRESRQTSRSRSSTPFSEMMALIETVSSGRFGPRSSSVRREDDEGMSRSPSIQDITPRCYQAQREGSTEVDSDVESEEEEEGAEKEKKKKRRRRLPTKKDPMKIGTRRHKMQRTIDKVYHRTRPVAYRMRPLTIREQTRRYDKRTRVTRAICSHRVAQFHETIDPDTGFVPDNSVAETVEEFLTVSKADLPLSSSHHDEFVAVGVEYDDTSKMFHFGRTMKKHSCRQKRLKFQMSWWPKHNKEDKKKRVRGFIRRYTSNIYCASEDTHLFQCHWNFYPNKCAPLHLVYQPLIALTMSRRDQNDVIRDSTYYVREFFVAKAQISFRLTRSADIPLMFVPPILRCGYFPLSATTVDNKKHYLACRYEEAQLEYFHLTYRDIKPKPGFKVGSITGSELYNFHRLGKHIHGFFLVWELEDPSANGNKSVKNKRYLVDMFHFQFFPLDVEYKKWEFRLRVAFDLVTTFNLQLAEIVRMNRPVFDSLARNPSFFKPVTLTEIVALMHEQGLGPKYYAMTCGNGAFYEWGVNRCNEDYLSAYFLIIGGTKVLNSNEEYDLEYSRVEISHMNKNLLMGAKGKCYNMHLPMMPNQTLANTENSNLPKELRMYFPMSEEEMVVTNLVTDTPIETGSNKIVLRRKPSRKGILMTREELIHFRREAYGLPIPHLKEKQKRRKIKKKPGRKPVTKVEKALKMHDFNTEFYASDVESEYEGYLSGSEEIDEKYPKMKRSQSAESFFIKPSYTDYFFDRLSLLHNRRFNPPEKSLAKRRRRKMNKLVQKHNLRYEMLSREYVAFEEIMECYRGTMPNLSREIARTKKSIRTNTYVKNNVPRVYRYGDAQRIDVVSSMLRAMVTRVVSEEHVVERTGNGLTRSAQESQVSHQNILIELKDATSFDLPNFAFLAMEFFSRRRILGASTFETENRELEFEMNKKYNNFMTLTTMEQQDVMMSEKLGRELTEFEELWTYDEQRTRQLDRTPKYIPFGKRSMQAEHRKEEERRETRRMNDAIRKRREIQEQMKNKDLPAEWLEKLRKEKERAEEKLLEQQKKVEEAVRLRALEQQRRLEAKKQEEEKAKQEKLKANLLKSNKEAQLQAAQKAAKEKEDREKASREAEEKRKIEKEEAARKADLEKKKKQEEEQRRVREEKEKQEAARRAEEERKKKEEEERLKQLAEAERKKKEEKETRQKQLAEAQRKSKEEAETRQKQLDEVERKRKERAEACQKKLAEAEQKEKEEKEAHLKKLAEAAQKQKEEEDRLKEVAERKKKEEAARLAVLKEKRKEEEMQALRAAMAKKRKNMEDFEIDYDDIEWDAASGPLSPEQISQVPNFKEKVVAELVHQYEKTEKKILMKSIQEYREMQKGGQQQQQHREQAEEQDEVRPSSRLTEAQIDKVKEWISKAVPSDKLSDENLQDKDKDNNVEYDDAEIEELEEQRYGVPHESGSSSSSTMGNDVLRKDVTKQTEMTTVQKHFDDGILKSKSRKSEEKAKQNVPTGTGKKLTEVPTPKIHKKSAVLQAKRKEVYRKKVHSAESTVEDGYSESNSTPKSGLPKTSIAFNKSLESHDRTKFQLTAEPCNKFWRQMIKAEADDSLTNRTIERTMLPIYMNRRKSYRKSGAEWTVGMFAFSCVLLTGHPYKQQSGGESPLFTPSRELCIDDDDPDLQSALESLVDVCVMFDQAAESPQDLRMLFKYNGFVLALFPLTTMYRHLLELFTKLGLDGVSLKHGSDKERIMKLYEVVSRKFERLLPSICDVSEEVIRELRCDADVVGYHCDRLESINIGSYPKHERRRAQRFQTIITWLKCLITEQVDPVKSIRSDVLEKFKLRNQNPSFEKSVNANGRKQTVAFSTASDSIPSPIPDYSPDESSRQNTSSRKDTTGAQNVEDRRTPVARPDHGLKNHAVPLGTVYQVERFARVSATVRVMSEREKKAHMLIYRNARKAQIALEKKVAHYISKHNDEFASGLFQAMQKAINRLPCWNDAIIEKTVHPPHVFNSTHSFRMAIRDSRNKKKLNYDNIFVPIADKNQEAYKDLVLQSFPNDVLTRETFNKLQWAVRCHDDRSKRAIEYYTNMEQYNDKNTYSMHLSTGFLPFEYKVFTLRWFLGRLLPARCDYDIHDYNQIEKMCRGCTNGDVILVHHCTCANHKDNNSTRFVYTEADLPRTVKKIQRLFGRFVCEHGPSDVLVLTEKGEFPPLENVVKESEHTLYSAKFPIDLIKTTHDAKTSNDIITIGDGLLTECRSLSRSSVSLAVSSEEERSPTPEVNRLELAHLFRDPAFQQILEKNTPKIDLVKMSLLENQAILKCQSRSAHFVKSLVTKSVHRRSKSADQPKRIEPSLRIKSSSLIDLQELEKYAHRKIAKAKEAIDRKRAPAKNVTWNTARLKTRLFEKNGDTLAEHQFEIIANIFKTRSSCYKESVTQKELKFEKLWDNLTKYSLLRIQGGDKRNSPKFNDKGDLLEGQSVSPVMDEYLSFMQYGKRLIEEAKMRVAATRLMKYDQRISMLHSVHQKVFNLNVHLLELLIHKISEATFTSFAMFEAERNDDLDSIRKALYKVKKSMPTILNSYCNDQPLKRQTFELEQLLHQQNVTAADINQHICSLARHAIERIRVPRCADKVFEKHAWVNKQSEIGETIDLLRVHVNDTQPSTFVPREFFTIVEEKWYDVREVGMRSINLNPDNVPTTTTLFKAFWNQSMEFYESLRRMLPKRSIDRKMKAYYECQLFLRLLNIVKRKTALTSKDVIFMTDIDATMVYSAIISNPPKETDPVFELAALTHDYNHLVVQKVKPLPIPPSYIGTTFVNLETEIVVAMVCEKHVFLDKPERVLMRQKIQGRKISYLIKDVFVSIILDKNNNQIQIGMRLQSDVEREDRLQFEMPPAVMSFVDPFAAIAHVINSTFGKLYNRLHSLPPRPMNFTRRLGRCELPFALPGISGP